MSLPADNTNLETDYTCGEYQLVAVDDNEYVRQTADDEFAVQQFKDRFDETNSILLVQWKGKMGFNTSDSTAYLQIYNYDTTSWETLDTDNSTSAGTEFVLSGSKDSSVSDYYDGSNWVSCRVYQEGI